MSNEAEDPKEQKKVVGTSTADENADRRAEDSDEFNWITGGFKVPTFVQLKDFNWHSPLLRAWDVSSPIIASGQYVAPFSQEQERFQAELAELRHQLGTKERSLQNEKIGARKKAEEVEELKRLYKALQEKERLGFLLDRVHPKATARLLESEEFRAQFLSGGECKAFVMSVDIRRSTELMLKAKTPELFAKFITELCIRFSRIITDAYGVFDKFTGDGVLAFFPQFYSGTDAALSVVSAADQCHAEFARHYKASRTSFSSVLTDIGLGIGIDYGAVRLVQVAGGLTVVGTPVVYACRLSGAPAGTTFLNQPAFELISAGFGSRCFINETETQIKHEGTMLAYEVRLNGLQTPPQPPDWMTTAEQEKKPSGSAKP